MPRVNIVVESPFERSVRIQQLEAMFDVPPAESSRLEWHGELPIEDVPWHVGLIVGPSGCGKSTLLKNVFGEPQDFRWRHPSVIDDFGRDQSMEEITKVCSAVGFNTVPAWMRPYGVLSGGEKFRVELARRLLEAREPIVIDEFTSVVDRQVAKIGSHAVQKYVRREGKRVVCASCHFDIIDWLQPDWIFEPGTMTFRRRSLRQRPELNCQISYVPHAAWNVFAPFHYLTANLHRGARCYALFVDGQIASIAGMLRRPHPVAKNVMGCSRLVTLPDWQGLGLAMVLVGKLGAAYRALGERMRCYPAHPSLISAYKRSNDWKCVKKGGDFSPKQGKTSGMGSTGAMGGRPCAVFEYDGPPSDKLEAMKLIHRNPRPELA